VETVLWYDAIKALNLLHLYDTCELFIYFPKLFFLFLIFLNFFDTDVENLIAEPDYRAVNLRWNYYNEHGLKGFRVK
jgi:hypothetical protein